MHQIGGGCATGAVHASGTMDQHVSPLLQIVVYEFEHTCEGRTNSFVRVRKFPHIEGQSQDWETEVTKFGVFGKRVLAVVAFAIYLISNVKFTSLIIIAIVLRVTNLISGLNHY